MKNIRLQLGDGEILLDRLLPDDVHFGHDCGAMGVRLRVEAAGCSGFGYRIEAAESLGEDDAVFEHGGVRLVVASASLA